MTILNLNNCFHLLAKTLTEGRLKLNIPREGYSNQHLIGIEFLYLLVGHSSSSRPGYK